jgi:hypothetical protein
VGLVCLHLFKLPRFLESTAYFQSAKWLLQWPNLPRSGQEGGYQYTQGECSFDMLFSLDHNNVY